MTQTHDAPTAVASERMRPDPTLPRRNSGRRNLRVLAATAWIGLVLVLAATADFLPLDDFERNVDAGIRTSPFHTWPEFFGTDRFGRSILTRLVFGARVSLAVGVLATAFGLVLGGIFGMMAGYFRGWFERVVEVLADSALAIPPLVLLLAMRAIWQPSLPLLILGLGVVSIPTFLRISRANTILFAGREFVRAAEASGATRWRILFMEILPNVALPLLSYAVVVMAGLIVAEGSLSFLGMGVPPPTPSWGGMIQLGRDDFRDYPHLVATPAIVLFLTVYAFNTIGDHFRGRLQVRGSNL